MRKFYSLDRILREEAQYNVIFSARSNGKTFACLEYAVKEYVRDGGQCGILRRWAEDIKGKRASQVFDALVHAEDGNHIDKITGGKWQDIYYYSGKWYLCKYTPSGDRVKDSQPFAHAFSLSNMEHDKSVSYSQITTVVFDEFLTRNNYLNDEFVLFMNVLSTIIRHRDNVKIFMLGNTVNHYCPYFSEMGLKHIKEMKQGDLTLYRFGESSLKVAVEFAEQVRGGKPSDKYFAFDNPKLSMITGKGDNIWEMELYPHRPVKFHPKDIRYTFFVVFGDEMLQCEVVKMGKDGFIFVHRKTTPIRKPESDLVYTLDYDIRPNWRRRIANPIYPVERVICSLIKDDRIFYQDNEVGETFHNFVKESMR